MKRYGYNWLLLIMGMLVFFWPSGTWLNFVLRLVFFPADPVSWSDCSLYGFILASGMIYLLCWGTYLNQKRLAEGKQATESKPVRIEPVKQKAAKPVKVLPPRQAMLYVFGGASAFVGTVSLVVHLATGRFSATEVAAFTFAIPLCCVAGDWLTRKAQLKETPEAASAPARVGSAHDTSVAVPRSRSITTEEAPATLVNHRG